MNPALKMAQKNTDRILNYVRQRVLLSEQPDLDDALEYAIKQCYGSYTEDAQADIFAATRHVFDEHPYFGMARKLALREALRKYAIGRILG